MITIHGNAERNLGLEGGDRHPGPGRSAVWHWQQGHAREGGEMRITFAQTDATKVEITAEHEGKTAPFGFLTHAVQGAFSPHAGERRWVTTGPCPVQIPPHDDLAAAQAAVEAGMREMMCKRATEPVG